MLLEKKILLFFLYLFVSICSNAANLSIRFNSADWKASGDLQLNQTDGSILPISSIVNWDDGGGNNESTFSFGDARHGVFNESTYENFSENGDLSGNIIRINTDTYPELHFSSFYLAENWTLQPTGSRELVIYSQSTVQIDGTINCQGDDGANAVDDETQTLSQALGRCKGANGGLAGYYNGSILVDGTSGTAGGANTLGGVGAVSDAALGGKGGGGGGAYNTSSPATSGKNPDDNSNIGNQGTSFSDNPISILAGGSGGGGGAAYRSGTIAQNSTGAGGGAGGGVVFIRAFGDVTVSASGKILASGGAGGNASAGRFGGAGGGGGGGTISIFSNSNVINHGDIFAKVGALGSSDGGGHGGAGGVGRTWIVEKDGAAGGSQFESPTDLFLARGTAAYSIGNYTLISKSFEFYNTAPEILSAQFLGTIDAGNTYSIEFASGDTESFTPIWKSIASLDSTDKKRFWKFRLSLNQANNLSSQLTGIDIEYNARTEDQFDLIASCGLVKNNSDTQNGRMIFFCLLFVPLFLTIVLKWATSNRSLSLIQH